MVGQLGYENSAVNSFIIFLISGFITIYLFRRSFEDKPKPLTVSKSLVKYIFLVLLISFVLPLITSMFFSRCPIIDGIFFYLVLVVPSVFLGTVAGYFSSALSRKLAYGIFVFIVLILIGISVAEFYYNPQIYFFNPLIGFTPGTIYDEALHVNAHLLVYRSINILFAIGILFISLKIIKKNSLTKIFSVLLIIILGSLFYLIKPFLGFSTDLQRIQNELPGEISTGHFIINYSEPKDHFSTPALIGLVHEYYFERINEELKINPGYKIRSFLFRDQNQKKEIFGSGNADVSKPWLHEIFLSYGTYSQSLKHELVHTLASDFGVTPFKVADGLNTAMIEGIATAIDNNFDGYPIHYAAKLAFEAGYKIKVSGLFTGANFFTQFPSVSYIYAGSFVRYLIDEYGINKIKTLYGNLNFDGVIGKNISQLEEEYYSFLKSKEIDFNKYKAQLYFAGQPIYKKFCPRAAASRIKKANELFYKKRYKDAYELYGSIYSYSGSYQSLIGRVNSLTELEKTEESENILKNELTKFKNSRYYFNLEINLADLLIRNNKPDEAEILYDSLMIQNPYIGYTNNVRIKRRFLKQGIDTLKKFILSETNTQFKMLFELNKNSFVDYSIPTLLSLCKDTSRIRVVCNLFRNAKVNDYKSSYAFLSLSRAAVYLYDFKKARSFAVEALKYNADKDYNFLLKENLRKISWLNNFSGELKPFFVYR